MTKQFAAHVSLCAVLAIGCFAQPSTPARPKAGKVEIFKEADVKPGMKATVWTVFSGMQPEPVPVEIIGIWKNAWGPKQDVILGKLGGKGLHTNVAAGMSGSPVYIDGKLLGALSLRVGGFSEEAICGITPIELMLEIGEFDNTKPSDARTPDRAQPRAALEVPGELLSHVVSAGAVPNLPRPNPVLMPIETPLSFAGFSDRTLQEFGPMFQQLGMTPVQGGASGALLSPKPAPGWQNALQPGETVTCLLVSGDLNINVLGTVTYNDGKRVLAFGHPFMNLGPVDMPIAKGDILMVIPSQFQPSKFGNSTEVVGALRQDRHSGILGELGATAGMIPVSLKVRSFGENNAIRKETDLHFNVFVHQKWTPYLMMATLFNSIDGLNDFSDEATYRLTGKVEMDGAQNISLNTMLAPSEIPVPAPMMLAGWWGDKFNKLFLNSVEMPKLKRVDATVDLLPQRRVATIENAWTADSEVEAGSTVFVKVFLRPYRGERMERDVALKLPAGLAKGEHRILLSDADTLNRMQSIGFMNRYIDIPETVSLLNQERSNNQLYVSLVQHRPTFYSDDKTLPSLPGSVLNVMQTGRDASRSLISYPESVQEQMALPFDLVVSGSYSLKINVK